MRQAELAAAVLFGRELDSLELDNTALEEVSNLPGPDVVAMPEKPNDPNLGVAAPDLVNHAISPRRRRNNSRSGCPPSPQRHAVIDQPSAERDLHRLEAA